MRCFPIAVVLALVLPFAGGPSLSALATISHAPAAHRRARRLEAVASSRHRTGHNAAHGGRTPASVSSVRSGRRSRVVALRAAHRRHTRIAPQKAEVAATIPAVPMNHWAILPPLVGSHESLVRQNTRTEADGLQRIEDDAQLNELRREKALVPLPVSVQLRVNEALPVNRRYTRPWTSRFLVDLARAHAARFGRSLQVNSAVRTVEYQRHLMSVNGNAAPADGDIASPHLSGATIDIAKKGLSTSEVSWMRAYLLPLEQAGKIDVEEEFYQSCFHITVYKSYAPPATPESPVVHGSLLAERVK
jgi:hypothetical protein